MSPSLKLAAFRKAELALAKQVAEFEALKHDPDLRKELAFVEKLETFLKENDMTYAKLAQFLNFKNGPAATTSHKAGATGAKPGPKPGHKPTPTTGRVYVNPHTNETITVKRVDHGVFQSWIAKYGEEAVEGWLQAA